MAGSGTELFLGDDNHYVKLANTGGVVINSNDSAGNTAQWTFGKTGTTQFPGSKILAPVSESITMQSDQYSQLMWENANLTVAPNMAINSNFYVGQNNATLDIAKRDGSGTQLTKSWYWNADGTLTLPEGGVISEGGGISGAIRLTPSGGANANQALLIYPTGVAEGDHIHLTAGGGSTELYLGNDFHYVKLVDGGNIELRAATANLSSQAAWTFDTTGNIDTIQALGIKVPDGVPTNVAVINSSSVNWMSNPMSNLATTGGSGSGLRVNVNSLSDAADVISIATPGTGYTNGDLITVTSGTSNATFTIVIAGRNSWQFGIDGNLTLPQTGYLKVGSGIVPAFISSPAPIITGFSNISAQNFTFLANGVNILSAVGAYQTFANANAATQATSINTINNTLTSANVGIGLGAGAESQGTSAVAIGEGAGSLDQGLYSVAIGNDAGAQYQGDRSVAVGTGAGRTNQGDYAVAIGRNAGYTNQGNNSIIINATTGTLNQTTANTFTVAPVRNDVANVSSVMFYNTTSKEVTYGNTISIAGNVNASQFNFANGVNILSTVGVGSYGNTQVAAYLLNFDGDIEFTSSVAKIGNVDVITVMDSVRSPAYQFSNGTSILSNVVTKVSDSWTVTTGTNTYSFTVPASGTYQLWVDCNIPNGILAWNATATVTNSNVPVVGAQYAWVYNGGGTPIDFVSIPNQFTGTANTIVRSNTAPSATTNRFDFGINNTSGGNVTVTYGYIKIS
jgi:hypothetical protein